MDHSYGTFHGSNRFNVLFLQTPSCLVLVPDRGVVVGTSLSKYLLEKSRVVFQVREWSRVGEVSHVDIVKYIKIYFLF